MRNYICEGCGKHFTPNFHNQKFCSKKCCRKYWYEKKKQNFNWVKRRRETSNDFSKRRGEIWGRIKSSPYERGQIGLNMEPIAKSILEKKLGFTFVNRFADYRRGRLNAQRKNFPFDFYAEKNGERWFIDCTCKDKKDLDKNITDIFKNHVKLKIGVIFLSKKLHYYTFKEYIGYDNGNHPKQYCIGIPMIEIIEANKGNKILKDSGFLDSII